MKLQKLVGVERKLDVGEKAKGKKKKCGSWEEERWNQPQVPL